MRTFRSQRSVDTRRLETRQTDLPPQVTKLAKLVDELRGGASFMITRLTVLKTLCRESATAQRFVTYLLKRAFPDPARIEGKAVYRKLGERALCEMSARVGEEPQRVSHADLLPLLREIEGQQQEFKGSQWGPIRIIRSNDLLLIEDALRCFVEEWNAPVLGLPNGAPTRGEI
ncbi:MAG: hypothetical protein AB9869_21005 [Verrucomicrobiia bacterium]